MALAWPPSPNPGDYYPAPPATPVWRWNGQVWVRVPPAQPVPDDATNDGFAYGRQSQAWERVLPLAGGDMTGPIILDMATPPATDEAVDREYVDEAVASGGLWQGTWDASANNPDLTQTALQRNGWGWTVVTPDPTAPFNVPATPAIPGVSGQTVYNGDHVIWSDAASTFEIVSGSSISRQEAEDLFPLKTEAMIRGVPGTYTQGTQAEVDAGTADFVDFQTFLDANINNRIFSSSVEIHLNTDYDDHIHIGNVQFDKRRDVNPTVNSYFDIITTAKIARWLDVTNVYGLCDIRIIAEFGSNVPLVYNNARFDSVTVARLCGDGTFGTTTGNNVYFVWGLTGSTFTQINSLNIDVAAWGYPSANDTPVQVNTLTVNGILVINPNITNFTVITVAPVSMGMIIDNRPGRPLETFLRWPATAYYTAAGTYTYVAPKTGIYEILAIGPGGAGTAWIGNPPFGTTGSPPRTFGGTSGQSARKQVTLPRGYVISVGVGAGGTQTDATLVMSSVGNGWAQAVGGDTWVGGTGGGDNDVAISPLQWHQREVVACGGFSGWNTGNKWNGQNIVQNGVNGTATAGGGARNLNGVSWAGPVSLYAGRGGDPGAAGQDGAVSIAYVSPA